MGSDQSVGLVEPVIGLKFRSDHTPINRFG